MLRCSYRFGSVALALSLFMLAAAMGGQQPAEKSTPLRFGIEVAVKPFVPGVVPARDTDRIAAFVSSATITDLATGETLLSIPLEIVAGRPQTVTVQRDELTFYLTVAIGAGGRSVGFRLEVLDDEGTLHMSSGQLQLAAT